MLKNIMCYQICSRGGGGSPPRAANPSVPVKTWGKRLLLQPSKNFYPCSHQKKSYPRPSKNLPVTKQSYPLPLVKKFYPPSSKKFFFVGTANPRSLRVEGGSGGAANFRSSRAAHTLATPLVLES